MTSPATTFTSTGSLPAAAAVDQLVKLAHERFCTDTSGQVSNVYPELARVSPDLFGLCVVATSGQTFAAGDAGSQFTLMSVSKPFVFALVCDALGPEVVGRLVGVNSTGLPFNSLEAVTGSTDGRTNPMVNPGAIVTTSLTPGDTPEERWRFLQRGLSDFAGRDLKVNQRVHASAERSNHRNRELACAVHARKLLTGDPMEAVELYTRQCSLDVTAEDLAVMGATLADGGVNPRTGTRVISPEACRRTLAVMATAGLYENSGEWLFDVGLPGKSGIGGGIVTVSPGKGALGTFAPRLDSAGNSVKGVLAARMLSRALGLDVFASVPAK